MNFIKSPDFYKTHFMKWEKRGTGVANSAPKTCCGGAFVAQSLRFIKKKDKKKSEKSLRVSCFFPKFAPQSMQKEALASLLRPAQNKQNEGSPSQNVFAYEIIFFSAKDI